MKSPAPFDKIQLIERSLHCFIWGTVGILPGIGVPFAIVGLIDFWQVTRHKGNLWNPADRYLATGGICATVGVMLTLVIIGILYIELS